MSTYSDSIIVPYDFTDKADFAIRHASIMAKNLGAEVVLLNIIKEGDDASGTEERLAKIAAKFSDELGVAISGISRVGTIFKTINEVVEEMKSALVVMATHGMKGMQKVTGSWALKVIVGCHVPYLIVQKEPEYHEVSNVLFPVDYKMETKEKLKWVSMLQHLNNINVCLFYQLGNGPGYDNPTTANLKFCMKYLSERGISYEAMRASEKGSFHELSMNYAKEKNIDVIMITTTRNISFHDYLLGAYEQSVIANEAGVPVFVVNPVAKVKTLYQNF